MPKTMRLPRTRSGRPKLVCTDDVLSYWAERIELVAPGRENFSYSSMICEGDSLYHYGHHFELARIMRDKRGRARLVLLNGDSYSGPGGFGPSTSSRQSDTRRAARMSNVPSLVVPFSALDAAGIDYGSIRPIHVRDDWNTIEEHSSRVCPTKKRSQMIDPSGAMRTETYWDYSSQPACEREREVPVYIDNPNETPGFSAQHGWSEGATRREDGTWRWHVRRHWLGDAIFRARTTETRTRKATADELADTERYRAWQAEADRLRTLGTRLPRSWARADGLSEGRYDYKRMFRLALAGHALQQDVDANFDVQPNSPRERNGRVPIQVTRWATFLSSFDYQEARPLYFLCELPHAAKPSTVDEAVAALRPPEVIAAQARGLKVVRQGDLFAIPTKLTKQQIRRMRGRQDFTKRLRVLGTNHSVTEGIVLKGGAVLGRGVMRHEPEGWRPPDHARQTLGDRWHLLVRNTVPRTH